MALQTLPLASITEDPEQPRHTIDDQALAEMAETMKTIGVIEPIVVKPDGAGFRLVVGHRRFRAARLAGLDGIPAIVRADLSDLDTMRMQAVEDVQNEELDPRDRYVFWSRLWAAERAADPSLTLATFAREVLGKSETYVKAGIQVAEEAPPGLQELLGRPEDGKLNPSYARYIINDRSLTPDEMVAVARKIASGDLPASGGRIGTETLAVIRHAPPKIRDRLIHENDYGIEQAKWEIAHYERQHAVELAREDNLLTPGQIAFKLLKAALDFHTKLDPNIAPYLPDEAWAELDHRFNRLQERVAEFRTARDRAPAGGSVLEAIQMDALDALLRQGDDDETGPTGSTGG